MKLVRYGPPGKEKPGLIDSQGVLRDLSRKVKDIDGAALAPSSIAALKKLEPKKLPIELLVVDKVEKTPTEN